MNQILDEKTGTDAELEELWRDGLTEEEYQTVQVKMAKLSGEGSDPALRMKLEGIPYKSVESAPLFKGWPVLAPAFASLALLLIVGSYIYSRPMNSSQISKGSDSSVSQSVSDRRLDFLFEDIVPLDDIFDEDIIILEELS